MIITQLVKKRVIFKFFNMLSFLFFFFLIFCMFQIPKCINFHANRHGFPHHHRLLQMPKRLFWIFGLSVCVCNVYIGIYLPIHFSHWKWQFLRSVKPPPFFPPPANGYNCVSVYLIWPFPGTHGWTSLSLSRWVWPYKANFSKPESFYQHEWLGFSVWFSFDWWCWLLVGLKKTVSGWDHIFGGLTVVDREFRKSINGFTQMGGDIMSRMMVILVKTWTWQKVSQENILIKTVKPERPSLGKTTH